MKILKSWIKDYINFDISDEELADKLSLSGSAVEDIIYGIDEKVIIAEIKKVEPHPNADRLRLATVFNGEKEQIVVCGAPNIEIGQKVPLAQLGAILPGGEIKKANIRGVESEGMLCAADELGLGTDHEGIIILPDSYIAGKPLRDYMTGDSIFDIEITPNRGDCLSHLGIAREIAALLDKKITEKKAEWPKQGTITCPFALDVKQEAIEGCWRYYGIGISGVRIKESSDFIKERLEKLGSKPINNIVDITNYLLLDLGQPMHAFDADKLEGKKVIVRFANDGEETVTLDGIQRKLTSKDLVIADEKKVIAVAGVMGCKNSEVDQDTKNIFLESAEFNPVFVRKTAKRLGLSTDASYRYERGIDRVGVGNAQNLAVPMIIESAGGQYTSGESYVYAKYSLDKKKIEIEHDKINNRLGTELTHDEINHILERLGFEIKDGFGLIPTWRNDIAIWQDLAEEVARIYGYNNIKRTEISASKPPQKSKYYIKEHIKDMLVDLGLSEVFGYTFLSEDDLRAAKLEAKDLLEVANPVQPENKYLRNSLIPNLLRAIAKNPTFDLVPIFEIGHVFTKEGEKTNIGIAISGKNAKNIAEIAKNTLAERLSVDKKIFEPRELTRDDLQRYKIKKPITFVIEANLDDLLDKISISDSELTLRNEEKAVHYRPLSKYPSVTRDLAFITNNDTDAAMVKDEIYDAATEIGRVELFDEFSSDKFGTNKKNIAFHLYLQHMDRTLTDEEANRIIDKIVRSIEDKFGAQLRDR